MNRTGKDLKTTRLTVTTRELNDRTVLGVGTELADDNTWASVKIYVGTGKTIVLKGTPRDLRQLASSISQGLRRTKR